MPLIGLFHLFTKTNFLCLPICRFNTSTAVSFKATPSAFPAFISSGWYQQTFLSKSTWFHVKPKTFACRKPVFRLKMIISAKYFGLATSIKRWASLGLNHRIRPSLSVWSSIYGTFSNQSHLLAAAFSIERISAKYLFFVLSWTGNFSTTVWIKSRSIWCK